MFSNQIDNAAKYSAPHSPMVLRVYATDTDGWVELQDSGKGIAAHDLERIFSKFYRANEAHAVPGAGLGLYLVRQLVRQHDGEVDVVSDAGKGSFFRVRLPLCSGRQ